MLAAGANPSTTFTNNECVLTSSIRINPEIAKELVEWGADVNHVDEFGASPLSKAIRYGDIDLIKYLLDKGARADRSMYLTARWRGKAFARIVRPAYYAWRDQHLNDIDSFSVSSSDDESSDKEVTIAKRPRCPYQCGCQDSLTNDDSLTDNDAGSDDEEKPNAKRTNTKDE